MSQENIFLQYCKHLPMRFINICNQENAENFYSCPAYYYIYPQNISKTASQICSPSVKGPFVRFQSLLKGESDLENCRKLDNSEVPCRKGGLKSLKLCKFVCRLKIKISKRPGYT